MCLRVSPTGRWEQSDNAWNSNEVLNLLWHIVWVSKCGRVECIQGMSVGNGYWMGLANSKGDKYGHTAHGVAQIALKDEHTQRQKADGHCE